MAINTYSTLQTAIANWMDRTDLTSRIPEFISLAEARINRKLKKLLKAKPLVQMETTATGTLATTGIIAFETAEIATSGLRITVSGSEKILDMYSREVLYRKFPSSSAGSPKGFAIEGDQIVVRPLPDGSYSYTKIYYQKVPALTDSNTTNWLLDDYPDIYLYGALCEAKPYLEDNENTAIWNSLFEQRFSEIESTDRFSGGTLRMRAI